MCSRPVATPASATASGWSTDMIAAPIGAAPATVCRRRRPAYLDRHGRPSTRAICRTHRYLRGRFPSGSDANLGVRARRRGREGRADRAARRLSIGGAVDLLTDAAIAGTGIVALFEDWLRPHFESGVLEPVLEPWWQRSDGPFLYYLGRRLVPALPLRAFIDFIKASPHQFLTPRSALLRWASGSNRRKVLLL